MSNDPKEEALKLELSREYDLRFTALKEYRERIWKVLTDDFFQQWVLPGDTVLDLGCGWGGFINNVNAAKKYGMDLNPSAPNHLNPDVIFLNQDCSKTWEVPDESLDVIFTSNFFEHLREKDQLKETILQAKRCLKKGGKIVCMGPNIKFLPGSYWDFWDHYLALTELSLAELFALCEIEVVQSYPRFLPYTMVARRYMPMILVKTYLKLPVVWPLFGRQFLVVGQKI